MGGGIAQVCAQAGYKVLVAETSQALLFEGLSKIETHLDNSVKKGKITRQDKDDIFSRIRGTTNIEEFNDCDLVIEAVIEDLTTKTKAILLLDNICPPHTLFATNTSSLLIKNIASATKRPDHVFGLHFFNPVPIMKLLEIVRTDITSESTIEAGKIFGESLGKTVVIVQDSPGFIVNRLMVPQILTAIRLVESGIATREDVDTAMILGLNHPIGPLMLADLIGLDTLLNIANNIYHSLGIEQYAAPEMLKVMVSQGSLGRKTGHGFYTY